MLINKLRKYNPKKLKKIKSKEETLSAAEKLLNNTQVIGAFKAGIFPYIDGFKIKEESEEELEDESEERNLEKMKDYIKNLSNILRMNQRA